MPALLHLIRQLVALHAQLPSFPKPEPTPGRIDAESLAAMLKKDSK
ncbi:MAG: hypothetical protein J0I23_04780 [Rhizobiales bacterium]|nr:hypothetical protein [Hyphomicrobiales bacterium]